MLQIDLVCNIHIHIQVFVMSRSIWSLLPISISMWVDELHYSCVKTFLKIAKFINKINIHGNSPY